MIEQLTSRVKQSFNGCPQCSRRGHVLPDCIFCGGKSVSLTSEQNKMIMAATNRKTDALKKTKSPSLDVTTAKRENEFTGTPMRFGSLVGGVLVAYVQSVLVAYVQIDGRRKNRTAICVKIPDNDIAWDHYCNNVQFVLFNQEETICRYSMKDQFFIAECRIIRDADDLPEAIAQAAADLWKAE